jgi:hypothetical protein
MDATTTKVAVRMEVVVGIQAHVMPLDVIATGLVHARLFVPA